jgi:hypothetical protein
MKILVTVIAAVLFVNVAHASDASCIAKADIALAKVAQTLGLGKGVGHIGGSEITNQTKDDSGHRVLTISGGVLAANDTDGYLTGTGAIIEMIETKKGCFVNSVSVSTGADFQAQME